MGTTWDDICKSVDSWTKKTNRKMEKATENAAVRIKISAKKAEMEDAYLELGKLAYQSLTSAEEAETKTEAIQAKAAEITALAEEIAALEDKIEKNKEQTED